ncbi:MAG: HlyD family efflux transporter periplasmic adaptor subunit [Planctomycetota bacterium]
MSQVQDDIDLAALARPVERIEPPRRGWLRIVLPLAILAAFAFVLRGALVELLRPRPEVSVVRPVRIEGPVEGAPARAASAGTGSIAVQAAGWVEPDPFATFAPALSGGVLLEVLVQESDAVRAGDPVARLVSDDAALARDRAAADVAGAEGALRIAEARARIASERYDAALEVTEMARSAEARRLGAAAEAEHRVAAVAEGEALVDLAESEVVVQQELDAAGAAGARQVELAEAALEVARAKLGSLRADLARVRASAEAAAATADRATRDLELRFVDRLERDVSEAEVVRAAGELERARAELATAELWLERTTVVAPVDGVVLERLATEGENLGVGAPVCSLFDPRHLRVRVDVPQSDLEALFVGQAAEILVDARGGRPYRGEVLRIVQRADIQKVTMEAQVTILEADGLVRPDMLAQVRFFDQRADGGAAADGSGRAADPTRLRIAIERRLVTDGGVWVFDPVAGVARHRTLELGSVLPGEVERVEVLAGLNLTDKVIARGRDALGNTHEPDAAIPVRVVEDETQGELQ